MNRAAAVEVRVLRIPEGQDLEPPARATGGSAGVDLRARLDQDLRLEPGARALVPTGLKLAIPPGYEGQVRPRSGLALRHGLSLANSPGTIDSDYRGEVGVILVNLGAEPFTLRRGERMAQLVLQRVEPVEWQEAGDLAGSERGAGGFGSSGV